MVSRETVEKQLKQIGCNFSLWGRSELAELPNVIMETETIAHCVNGHYENGFALLCATDHRVLLIDKKPMNYLNVQDVRFEMISEFDYSHRLLNAGISICTPTKALRFSSWNQPRLRALLAYVQQRVIEIRQYYYLAHQFQAIATQQLQPQPAATYVPNMAFQTQGDNARPRPSQGLGLSSAASHLGVFTSTKLPHFRRRNSRSLGRYAIPDEIYPPQIA
jgi:hypothetical protein